MINESDRRAESVPTTEQSVLRHRFTDKEKEILLGDGAEIYLPTRLTIPQQIEAQRVKGKPSFYCIIDGGYRLLAVPSKKIELAIYPNPERFFVLDSFRKNLKKQEEVVAKDAQDLRDRLGLQGITEIIPDEASTLTEIVFQHLDKTGVWLLGRDQADVQDLYEVFVTTKNPTNRSGSRVAHVGSARPDRGLCVLDWNRDVDSIVVGVVRVVVPIEIK